jgi:hypothetical protein
LSWESISPVLRRREMLMYFQPSENYTYAHLIKGGETWQPQECPNHPPKTQ